VINKYIWGILSAICFGSLTAIGKFALMNTTPETVLLLRFALVCILIGIGYLIVSKLRDLKLKRKDLPIMTIAGLAFSFETIGFWIALDNIDIIPLLSIFWAFPLFGAMLDLVIDRSFNVKIFLLLILGFLGVLLVNW